MKRQFNKIAIIGIGLIGSSLIRIIRQKKLARVVAAYDRSKEVRILARKLPLTKNIYTDISKCVSNADLIILCTPVGEFKNVAKEISPFLKRGAILSDVGSVKEIVFKDVARSIPHGVHLIPAHPIAGTEYSGPAAGFPELFIGRWCIITPMPRTNKIALRKLRKFWEGCGSRVEEMHPRHHDIVLAVTSHVPHLIAYNIVGTADELKKVAKREVIKYSAGGFRDFTRIAASDPIMWRDVFLNNKSAVLEVLGRFNEDLSVLQRAIREGDGDKLFDTFSRTRAIRHAIIDVGQDSPAPNFGRDQVKARMPRKLKRPTSRTARNKP
jgi:cyclohexadieny/prephenate dehydrogenase